MEACSFIVPKVDVLEMARDYAWSGGIKDYRRIESIRITNIQDTSRGLRVNFDIED